MGEKVHIWGDLAAFGTEFFRELTEGEAWMPHPENGIIVTHPDRQPLWCRMEIDAYRQDWIDLSEIWPTPLERETRRAAHEANDVLIKIANWQPADGAQAAFFSDLAKKL